ncbi:nickel pincer cofactor biosynthesis protein LarB [Alteribacillus sp. JSM 102045]|uniref:nickel pincer cofactor biosynthesis protein LarB n=1 Tax=Alteribacillus sp. JSM 102045 TaxID=1562101 RepID=UPI0035C03CEB
MTPSLKDILQAVEKGDITSEQAHEQLKGYENLSYARVDSHRGKRKGFPEVIYGEGKTPEQIIEITGTLRREGRSVLCTRIDQEKAAQILAFHSEFTYDPVARILHYQEEDVLVTGRTVGVLCAGTSDLPVAEEAAVTAETMGNKVVRVYDVGVAGIHRLIDALPEVKICDVLIVVAGMEGALPSVIGGLADQPIIAVPTSVGYGAHFEGLAPLLGMLNSCSSGISVVNIDNGFGAAYSATLMNRIGLKGGERCESST